MRRKSSDFKLCYIDLPWVYFTSNSLDCQSGDDWSDIPYEHNSGIPYSEKDNEILCIAIETNMTTPDQNSNNNAYSVDDINRKKLIPWLIDYIDKDDIEAIWAGTDLSTVCSIIKSRNGKIYYTKEDEDLF